MGRGNALQKGKRIAEGDGDVHVEGPGELGKRTGRARFAGRRWRSARPAKESATMFRSTQVKTKSASSTSTSADEGISSANRSTLG